MSGAKHRRKGNCIERELVDRHKNNSPFTPNVIHFPAPADSAAADTTSICIRLAAEAAPIVAEVKVWK